MESPISQTPDQSDQPDQPDQPSQLDQPDKPELAPGGYPIDPTLERRWGVAESGDVYEGAVRPHLIDELRRRWPPIGLKRQSTPAGAPVARIGLSDKWIVVPDAEVSGDNPPLLAWDMLERSLAVFSAHRLTKLVAVHSSVVAWKGRALVVPALSGGGKSTLTRAAHNAGATVLSDEYTLIDPGTGLVTGWNRPVRILTSGDGIDRLDIAVRSEPIPVGAIAFLTHDAHKANNWATISRGDATGKLLTHTICGTTRPNESLDAALAATADARLVAGTRGEADDAIVELLEMTVAD
ncbi:MAG: hypothetical protein KDA95_10075 [Acidimicrobiales bacterium]|nr:hypothetical protein [Acidimicrobiales bacterium]